MSNYSNAVTTMIQWMQANDFPESEINAIYIGADMYSVDDLYELATGIGKKEAVLAELVASSTPSKPLMMRPLNIPDNETSTELKAMSETGDDADAASAIYTAAENFLERNL